jgi:hypothetical protein
VHLNWTVAVGCRAVAQVAAAAKIGGIMRRLLAGGGTPALAAGAALLAAGGGYAIAAGAGTIHACANKHGGALRVAGHCKRSERALSWNMVGPTGPRGSTGQTGPMGPMGGTGPAGPITGTLPRGVTLKGTYFINSPTSAGGQAASQPISFGLQLAAAPTVHYIPSAGTVPAGCSGTVANPGAAPGNFCLFEGASFNGSAAEVNPLTGTANQATTFGGAVTVVSGALGSFNTYGSWAVTGS